VRRADRLVRLREPRRRGVLAEQLGEAEVGDAHAAVLADEDVLGLDVAVHDAVVVRELQRIAQLRHEREHVARGQLALQQQVAQVGAVDELHHQEEELAGLAEVVDADDARVVQHRQRPRFAFEAFGERRVGDEVGAQHLHGDEPVELASGARGRRSPCHRGRAGSAARRPGTAAAGSRGRGRGAALAPVPLAGVPVGRSAISMRQRGQWPPGGGAGRQGAVATGAAGGRRHGRGRGGGHGDRP
jgi:hypothetical protein